MIEMNKVLVIVLISAISVSELYESVKRCHGDGADGADGTDQECTGAQVQEPISVKEPQPNWAQRRDDLEKYCKDHDIKKINPKHLMMNMVYISKLNLNWCLVPKVASTSISTAILPYLKHLEKDQKFPFLHAEVWARAGRMTYEEYQKQPNSTPAFFITRHPFARVASAFRNKLEVRTRSHDGEYFYNLYSTQIIKLLRGSWKAGDKEPTFAEFIHYLLNTKTDNYDEHWQPVATRCRVCQLKYSHILHYEAMETEWQHFLEDINLADEMKLPWENKGSSGTKLMDYFSNITDGEKDQLYKKYQTDFEIFGYSLADEF